MKKLLALLLICGLITGCGAKEEAAADVADQAETKTEVEAEAEVEEEAEAEAEVEEDAEAAVVSPLPATVDINALDNCTVAVSFEEGDAYVNDEGVMMLDVTVYTYDLYDMVDIAALKEGDTIVIQGNEVVVESLETLESGLLFINGGMEEGGYDLWHDESGVYFEHGMNDAKSYYAIGETSIRVSVDFEFADSSDPEKETVTYFPGDFLTEDAGIVYNFVPNNTSIVIEDGQVISMTRIFTP